MSLTVAESAAVVADLRRARRSQRVAEIHWVDALYQVYITGLVAVVAVIVASGLVGDGKIDAAAVADVRVHAPAGAGILVALAVLTGLRSGSRGGPLALERPDVRHVLLAPVDRGVALRGPAWRQLRFLAACSVAVGATVGQLALRRLPGNGAAWMGTGVLFALTIVALSFGCALVASGTGMRSWHATALGGSLLVWSVGDVLDRLPTAPASVVGRMVIWPIHVDALALAGSAVAALLVWIGMRLVAHTSLEAAERRTELVGQLRFAVTLQDLRTVLVLRRQLAQERPRSRPWIPAVRPFPSHPVLQRGLRSVARWPASRIGRVLVLAVVAGAALRGAWSGTTPLVVLAGVALWVAGLDAVEPMGQEIDHPGRTDAFPLPRGQLLVQHLPVVFGVGALVGLLAGAAALVPIGDPVPAGPALLVGAIAGLLAACGAVVSVIQGAPSAVDTLGMMTPEIAGTRTVIRTAWPPALAVLGTLPLLAARASDQGAQDPPPVQAALSATFPLVVLACLVAAWVRFHDPIHEWFREIAEQASPTKMLERQAAEREAEEEREREQLEASRRIAEEAGGQQSSAKPKPKTRPQAAPEGVRGGTSAKPIGRRRDQATAQASGDDEPDRADGEDHHRDDGGDDETSTDA